MRSAAGSATRSIPTRIMRAVFIPPPRREPMARRQPRQAVRAVERSDSLQPSACPQPSRGIAAVPGSTAAWNKRYQVGAAAMNGVICRHPGAQRFRRRDRIRSRASTACWSATATTPIPTSGRRPRDIYETMKIGVKPYPSCRYTHAALDALIAMRREAQSDARPDQARRDRPAPHGITLTGDAATKRHPTLYRRRTVLDVLHGCRGARSGRFGWDDYERLGDAKVDALADKFDVVQDDRLETAAAIRSARASALPPTTACMSGSTLIPPANRDRFRTRRRWRRNS